MLQCVHWKHILDPFQIAIFECIVSQAIQLHLKLDYTGISSILSYNHDHDDEVYKVAQQLEIFYI